MNRLSHFSRVLKTTLSISLALLLCTSILLPIDKEKLETINKQIEDISIKLDDLKKQEGSILSEIYKTELQYDRANMENNKLKIILLDTEEKINKKNKEKQSLETGIQKSRENIKRILRIMYKIGGNSYLKIFIQVENMDQLFQNYRLFMSLINYKSDEISKIKEQMRLLAAVKAELDNEYNRQKDIQKQKELHVNHIRNLRNEKLQLINRINNDRENYTTMLDELETEAVRLNELIYGKQIKRKLGVLDISKIKGKLRWPIDGKIVSSFGKKRSTRFNTYIINNGIKIAPSGSDEVRSVYSGEVVFSDYYKGYGNLLIIQHARNLYSLYGHCDKILKKIGDNVNEGEIISIAGDTGSTYGKVLYFEIRTHLQPQDPLEWLRKK